jgi:acyl-CoA thioester hydrolase
MYKHSTSIRVRYAETDKMGVVYHGNFFAYFEESRANAIRALGYTYAAMEEDGYLMPVVEVQCKYIRPIVYDELIKVETILKEMPTGHKVVFTNEIYNEQNEIACIAQIVLYFLDAKDRKSKREIPEKLLSAIQPFFN